jgi:hypothetical protein
MPKITSIQDTGRMWKEFHILEVQFDNNDGGTALAKSPTPSYKVGDDVQYEKNERGGIKIQREQSNNFSNNSNYSPKVKQDNSEQIARSVVFKGAIDLVSSGKMQITDIPSFVEKYLGVVTGASAQGETYQAHFQDSSPF